ncbi:MAG TPA: adenylate/guanylate cyclase domain-containing protein [Alphaproteobacteria bacterium]|nr:adenylate/guanylate cyclase domain-containing protein [Alphaproteobacteria bacterium]
MDDAQFAELAAWIAEAGLAGKSETEMVTGFCTRAIALGLPLARASVLIDTLHPIYEGRHFSWQASERETELREYGFSGHGEVSERWRRSPFYRLVQSGESLLRRRVNAESEAEFPILTDMAAAGITDYVAMVNRFAAEGIIGEMDCVYSSWATEVPQGFRGADLADLKRLVPLLALAVKSASLARIAKTLVETYLGRDAGRRVLEGRIVRGTADRIEAVLWFSDLRGYTRITDTAAPGQIIPLLNDYADAIISAIHAAGGDVLKLMGDGTLAIFTAEDREEACRAALAAASAARRSVVELNRRRSAASLPVTDMYLGLHFGEVFYGNIGSKERLDFTVVGPAVNEASRIAALCRSVEQPVLLSATFASAAGEARRRLVSVGRYALRGVGRPQELFTLDPAQDSP